MIPKNMEMVGMGEKDEPEPLPNLPKDAYNIGFNPEALLCRWLEALRSVKLFNRSYIS